MSSEQVRLVRGFRYNGAEVSVEDIISADGMATLDVSVPDSSTDLELVFALDVSQVSAIIIHSDQDITIETNSGSSPDDTINVSANKQIDWRTEDGAASKPFTADITTNIFVTNSSGSAARLRIFCPYDATP